MVAVYLVVASINHLALVASRVIRWASTWYRLVFSAVTVVCLAWTWRGQAQWLWVSACMLVLRHARAQACPVPTSCNMWVRIDLRHCTFRPSGQKMLSTTAGGMHVLQA